MAKKAAPKPKTPPLIEKLRGYPGEHPPHHPRKRHTLETLLEEFMALSATVLASLDAQDAKIAALATKVDAFIASHPPVDPADETTLVDRVNAQGAAVDAISQKLG